MSAGMIENRAALKKLLAVELVRTQDHAAIDVTLMGHAEGRHANEM